MVTTHGDKVPKLPITTQISFATKYHNSFACRAARLCNALPINVNTAEDFASFKILLGNRLKILSDRPPAFGYILDRMITQFFTGHE